jgi:hypothetical protein
LEKEENPDDKRETIYSPITDKQGKLFGENKIPVKDATVYPSQENMTAWIDEDISDAAIVEPSDGTIVLPTERIVRKYYSDASTCFYRLGYPQLSLSVSVKKEEPRNGHDLEVHDVEPI